LIWRIVIPFLVPPWKSLGATPQGGRLDGFGNPGDPAPFGSFYHLNPNLPDKPLINLDTLLAQNQDHRFGGTKYFGWLASS
jgi:hypothetical protein